MPVALFFELQKNTESNNPKVVRTKRKNDGFIKM